MNHDQFVADRQAGWQELEALLQQLDRRGWRSLTPAQLDRLSTLYLIASADLATAANQFPQGRTQRYLNSLVSRAHIRLYSTKTTTWRHVWHYLWYKLPATFLRHWQLIALAFAVFMAGACFGYAVFRWQPQYAVALVGPQFEKVIQSEWQGAPPPDGSGFGSSFLFSSALMINNIRVAVLAFGLGLTFGLGTAYVLFMNGALLGVLAGAMPAAWRPHLWSLIAPHAVPELLAIFIAGGAGFLLAWSLIRPGDLRRLDSVSVRGRQAVILFVLVIPLLVIAGLIEGLLTPARIPQAAKFGFAALAAVALIFYFHPARQTRFRAKRELSPSNTH